MIDRMVRELRRTLVGPRGGEREVLLAGDDPMHEYLAGVLFPAGAPEDAEDELALLGEGEEPEREERVGGALNNRRGSIGITCRVSGVRSVRAVVEYGTYAPDPRTGRFERTPHSAAFSILLDGSDGSEKIHESRRFELRYSSRDAGGAYALSVFAVNGEVAADPLAEDCMFQPCVRLESEDGSDAFVDRGGPACEPPGPETEMLDMLFRGNRSLAVGHGCAVEWRDGMASSKLESALVPAHAVRDIRPAGPDLDCMYMKCIYESGRRQYADLLRPLADAYEEWIGGIEDEAARMDARHARAARARVADCRSALRRIRRGIDIVSSGEAAGEAFAFASRAMYLYQREVRRSGPEPRWRPFQLAFLLMNVESITDSESEDRRAADLLWFPTGGGKTEAYMGLIAFAMAHRRVKNKRPDYMRNGTVAIMRYTLRLLTLQQFQRAAGLMCACEVIRKSDEKKWGDEPFCVGLWVGSKVTPNRLDDAKEHLGQGKAGGPVQLLACPWCGERLGPRDYRVREYDGGAPGMCRAYCPNAKCDFHRDRAPTGLPVLTVDEDIYRQCPPLIIGTVDKFAQTAWKADTASIFGRVDTYCQKHGFVRDSADQHCHKGVASFRLEKYGPSRLDPPDLLIQDETHLISGPLGTMVAMYEAVVDRMCSAKAPPKVVASTATAAGAAEQMRAVFGRQRTRVFPPQGLEFGDSFFSEPAGAGRTHVGVCADASPLSALASISGALMAAVRREESGSYRTLVAYFNSLRELGAASQAYDDSVPAEIMRHARMQGAEPGRSERLEKREMSSRTQPSSIAGVLGELESGAVDVLLCTNMFSVGVDVPNLGVMVVNGQPKNHSEYIQACGRIGRKSPGLVVTIYRQTRPRDLSHYENFAHYHSALHRNVEPPVVTPFSPRARDRALFGMLVALVRLQEKSLSGNARAGKFGSQWRLEELISDVRSHLSARAAGEAEGTAEHLDRLAGQWRALAAEHPALAYSKSRYRRSDPKGLMRKPGGPPADGFVEVPVALRTVEEEIDLAYVGASDA